MAWFTCRVSGLGVGVTNRISLSSVIPKVWKSKRKSSWQDVTGENGRNVWNLKWMWQLSLLASNNRLSIDIFYTDRQIAHPFALKIFRITEEKRIKRILQGVLRENTFKRSSKHGGSHQKKTSGPKPGWKPVQSIAIHFQHSIWLVIVIVVTVMVVSVMLVVVADCTQRGYEQNHQSL